MQNLPQQPKVNPLAGLMRQPKLTIKLPSQGHFWSAGSINLNAANEYKVYSMTAKDELLLKNPATQSGGKALVEVIQSCIPDIRNAWETPGIDLDTILIGIRIATYGPKLKVPVTVEDISAEYEVNLLDILDNLLAEASWNEQFPLDNGMIVFLSPMTAKIMKLVNDEKMDEEQKVALFRESFVKLTDITLNVVASSVKKIITDDGAVVENPKYIQEFMDNVDRDVFTKIRLRINELTLANSIKPLKVESTPAMRQVGVGEVIDLPIEFSPENFFQ